MKSTDPRPNPNGLKQPLGPWGYATLSLVALLIAVGLLLFYAFRGQALVRAGADSRVFYFLLIPLGISAASFLFGAMRSYARFTSTEENRNDGRLRMGFELGGPAAFAALVVLGGFKLVPSESNWRIGARIVDEVGGPISHARGEMTLYAPAFDPQRRDIDSNGYTAFTDLPTRLREEKATFSVNVQGWVQEEPSREYPLSDSDIRISLKKKN